MVEPSSAVTSTVRSLSPTTRFPLPVTRTEADGSEGVAVTATACVPEGTTTVLPSTTLAPETLKTTRLLILDGD